MILVRIAMHHPGAQTGQSFALPPLRRLLPILAKQRWTEMKEEINGEYTEKYFCSSYNAREFLLKVEASTTFNQFHLELARIEHGQTIDMVDAEAYLNNGNITIHCDDLEDPADKPILHDFMQDFALPLFNQ